MCRDVGDGVVPSAGAYVVSSLMPEPGQCATDVAFADRSNLHGGLLSESALLLEPGPRGSHAGSSRLWPVLGSNQVTARVGNSCSDGT